MTFSPENLKKLESGLKDHKINYEIKTWKNFMENVEVPGACVIQIDKHEQVKAVMLLLERLNSNAQSEELITIKCVGGYKAAGENYASGTTLFSQKGRDSYYSSSYSFSPVGTGGSHGHVILEFSKVFQQNFSITPVEGSFRSNPAPDDFVGNLPAAIAHVPSGMQLYDLENLLLSNGYCLPNPPMVNRATIPGVISTGGHGTEKEGGPLGSYQEQVEVYTPNGELKTLDKSNADFDTLANAHLGMIGAVTTTSLRVPQKFKLKEEIHQFHDLQELLVQVPELMKKPYCTINMFPTKGKPTTMVQVWTPTEEEIINPYDYNKEATLQEIGVKFLSDKVQNLLVHPQCKELLPEYHRFMASLYMLQRGTKTVVDWASHITHNQKAYPKKLHDVSYIFDNEGEDATRLTKALTTIYELISQAQAKGDYPVTYTIYVRFIAATKDVGLAPTFSNHPVIAIDIVTHPQAPGLAAFEESLVKAFEEQGIKVGFHLGKELPAGVKDYSNNYTPEHLQHFTKALESFSGPLEKNPFVNPINRKMLGLTAVTLQNEKAVNSQLESNKGISINPVPKERLTSEHHTGKPERSRVVNRQIAPASELNPVHRSILEDVKSSLEKALSHQPDWHEAQAFLTKLHLLPAAAAEALDEHTKTEESYAVMR